MPKNARGFGYKEFQDVYGAKCKLSQSSAIGNYDDSMENPGSSFVWLGVTDADPKIMCSQAESLGVEKKANCGWQPYPIPKEVLLTTQMHLNREQVKELIEDLQRWLETGEIG